MDKRLILIACSEEKKETMKDMEKTRKNFMAILKECHHQKNLENWNHMEN